MHSLSSTPRPGNRTEPLPFTRTFRGLLALWASCLISTSSARADVTVQVAPQTTWGTWEGWGASLCWWANVFGTRDDLADLLFTTRIVTFNGRSLPGLGLNIARYNAGACTSQPIQGQSMQVSPNIPPHRQMQGFWLNWFDSSPTSSSWNWNADANQRAMLLKARARGANVFELFSNSPLWWMCVNHNPSGSPSGSANNLQSWNTAQHATYLATIARYAADNWGIRFQSVEPFNEPSSDWWTATGRQEGCHIDVAQQAEIIGHLRAALDTRGLNDVLVAASDETDSDTATATWSALGPTARSRVDRINVHGYQYGGGRRDLLYRAKGDKRLWNSEYGEADHSGISLASNLNLDFRWLHPTAWCYWQPLDSGGWGLIQSNPGDNWIGPANPKYFVLAQYTRHIRPGMTVLESGDANTVAAYDGVANRLVLVTMNYGTAQGIQYDLSRFPVAAGPVRAWTTSTGTGPKYARLDTLAVNNRSVTTPLGVNTIQTLEIDNVLLNVPPPPTLRWDLNTPGALQLSWASEASVFRLQSRNRWAGDDAWQTVTNQPTQQGQRVIVTMPMPGEGTRFYRLAIP